MPTDKLVLRYLSDLAQYQSGKLDESKTFGTLQFSVAYFKEKSVVEVNILQGMNLPSLDSNGTSDIHR